MSDKTECVLLLKQILLVGHILLFSVLLFDANFKSIFSLSLIYFMFNEQNMKIKIISPCNYSVLLKGFLLF